MMTPPALSILSNPIRPTRRTAIRSLAALAALPALAPFAARAASGVIGFDVLRGESRIGGHSVSLVTSAGTTEASIDIELKVKAAFITVFDYKHTNRETWRDGRLVRISTRTSDNGKLFQLDGAAEGDLFRFEGSAGPMTAPASILPSSYWNAATLGVTQLLDTQRGKILNVSVEGAGLETITAAGQSASATPYRMRGDLNIDLWYTPAGEWAKLTFAARGATIDYVRTTPLAG